MNAFDAILQYWFETLAPKDWWSKGNALDAHLASHFGSHLAAAKRGELFAWRDTPDGRLAEVLVLDQFSRHIFRDTPEAFAADGLALVLAQEAVRAGADTCLPSARKAFLYMPYMHSESPLIHDEAVRLFNQPGLEETLAFELRHKAIIDRFGRYPHRNHILGRVSTADETAFLAQPGSGF